VTEEAHKVGVPLKAFVNDPDTNPWHWHNGAHGIYILAGTLRTHAGTFGLGSFLWFPEGYAFEDEQEGSTG
jgi:hypothetical protein